MKDITKIIIPIPPIHCVKERQKCKDFGNASTLIRVELPVVVKHTCFQKALAKEGIASLMM